MTLEASVKANQGVQLWIDPPLLSHANHAAGQLYIADRQ